MSNVRIKVRNHDNFVSSLTVTENGLSVPYNSTHSFIWVWDFVSYSEMGIGSRRKLHPEDLHNLCSSHSVVIVIKSLERRK